MERDKVFICQNYGEFWTGEGKGMRSVGITVTKKRGKMWGRCKGRGRKWKMLDVFCLTLVT